MKSLLRFLSLIFLFIAHASWSEDDNPGPALRVLQLNVWQEGTSVPGVLEKIADAIIQSRADVVAFSEVRNYRGEDWHTKILVVLKTKAPEVAFYGQFVGGDVKLVSRIPIASTVAIFDQTKADAR